MALVTGTVLNNTYRIVRLLGKGSMGNVYLVERIKDDKKFVIKELMFSEKAPLNREDAWEIFKREAAFMEKFDHFGIPEVYGVFSEKDRHYLVMDYVEGKTLEEIINSSDKPVEIRQAIKWTVGLCEILDYLHNSFKAPIVYRDLKPSNIIINSNKFVRLVDFGIARYYNPDKDEDTFSYGSPGYAPPEQYKGRGQSSPQTDIFALGVILFQMLTGYDPTLKPFHFPSMKSLNLNVPEELEKIVNRAIQLEPLKRYISMAEFKEALENYLYGKKIEHKSLPSGSSGTSPYKAPKHYIVIFFFLLAIDIVLGNIIYKFTEPGGLILFFITSLSITVYYFWYGIIIFLYFLRRHIRREPDEIRERINYQAPKSLCVVLCIITFLAMILIPNFLKARASGMLAACESNLKNIATAIEMYASDNEFYYPPSLDYLTMNHSGTHYIRSLPGCPGPADVWRAFSFGDKLKRYNYIPSDNYDNFTLTCPCSEVHIETGTVSSKGCWPQYTPGEGIKLK